MWVRQLIGFAELLGSPSACALQDRMARSHPCAAYGWRGRCHAGRSACGSGIRLVSDSAVFRPPRPNEVSQSVSVHVENVDRPQLRRDKRQARDSGTRAQPLATATGYPTSRAETVGMARIQLKFGSRTGFPPKNNSEFQPMEFRCVLQ